MTGTCLSYVGDHCVTERERVECYWTECVFYFGETSCEDVVGEIIGIFRRGCRCEQ